MGIACLPQALVQSRQVIKRHRGIQVVFQMVVHLFGGEEEGQGWVHKIGPGLLVRIVGIWHIAMLNRPPNPKKYLRQSAIRYQPIQDKQNECLSPALAFFFSSVTNTRKNSPSKSARTVSRVLMTVRCPPRLFSPSPQKRTGRKPDIEHKKAAEEDRLFGRRQGREGTAKEKAGGKGCFALLSLSDDSRHKKFTVPIEGVLESPSAGVYFPTKRCKLTPNGSQ